LLVGAGLAWGVTTHATTVPKPLTQRTRTPFPFKTTVRLWLLMGLGSYSGLMVLGMAAKIMDAAGTGLALASGTLAGVALGNTLGRLSVGWIDELLGMKTCLALSCAATLVGLGLVGLSGIQQGVLPIGLILIATGYGLVASIAPLLTRLTFGAQMFQRRYGVIFSAWGVAGCAAPWIAGALFDKTGSFAPGIFSALMASILFAGVAIILARDL